MLAHYYMLAYYYAGVFVRRLMLCACVRGWAQREARETTAQLKVLPTDVFYDLVEALMD
jgi:hypothetical protein